MNFNDAIPNFRGYNGSSLIKQAGLSINWTPEMITELQKCAEDPVYFARTYLKVIHVDRGLVPMDLYDYQAEILENFKNNRNLIIAASRQCGKCVYINTAVRLRNKKTGEVIETTVGDLYAKEAKNRQIREQD